MVEVSALGVRVLLLKLYRFKSEQEVNADIYVCDLVMSDYFGLTVSIGYLASRQAAKPPLT